VCQLAHRLLEGPGRAGYRSSDGLGQRHPAKLLRIIR
jgi:hypothetical protein